MYAQNLLKNAELSLAAYANLNTDDLTLQTTALEEAGFSAVQAFNFANRYSVVTQFIDNEDFTDTGFSATIFKDSAGDLTIAFRGTEISQFVKDVVVTDRYILDFGAGYDQIVAMYNWWLQISSESGTIVPQYKFNVLTGVLENQPSTPATSELANVLSLDSDQKVDVTGHSLGAHLALAFNTLFSNETDVVTGFNTPGFIKSQANQNFFSINGVRVD